MPVAKTNSASRGPLRPLPDPLAWLGLCSTACAAIAVEALLRSRSLPQACKLLGVEVGAASRLAPLCPKALAPDHARVHADVAKVYTWLPLPDTCLRRALTAGFRLRSEKPQLVIGIRKSHHLDAHAWLVTRGAVIDWSDKYHEYAPIR